MVESSVSKVFGVTESNKLGMSPSPVKLPGRKYVFGFNVSCMEELIRVVQLCSCIQFKQLSSMSAKLRDFFYCWLRSSHNGMQVIYDSLRYLMMGTCNNETWPRNEYTTQHHVHAQLRCRANLVYLRGEKCQTGILLLSGGNLPDTFSLNIFSRVSDNSS